MTTDTRPRLAGTCARLIVASLFLLAAALKAMAPGTVIISLRHQLGGILPDTWLSTAFVVGLVVFWEVMLAFALVAAPPGNTIVRSLTIGTLLVFSGYLAVALMRPGSPACGCSGLSSRLAPSAELWLGAFRNVGLLALFVFSERPAPGGSTRCPSRESAVARARRAFTLIELLVTVVVIWILITLMLPALSHARAAGRESRSLSDLRQAHLGLHLYSRDSRERFPFLGTPGNPNGPLFIRGHVLPRTANGGFWAQAALWPSVVVPEYLSSIPRASADRQWAASALSPSAESAPEWLIATPLLLSFNAMAGREFWDNIWKPSDVSLYRATSWSDLLFPSQKGLLWDTRVGGYLNMAERDPRFFTAYGDGSAGFIRASAMDPALVARDPYTGFECAITNTYMGLAGIDRR